MNMSSDVSAHSRIVILVAIDGTDVVEDVMRTATVLAQTLAGSELHLVHVIPPIADVDGGGASISSLTASVEGARALTEGASTRARRDFSGRVVQHIAFGAPSREILQLATSLEADLIVVGPHRRNPIERWVVGSVAEQVVRKASCAVLVARAKDYAAGVPEIEPACPGCVATQKATRGEKLWCTRHRRSSKTHAHLHYEIPTGFAVGSQLIRTEG
jgi:nucleotide-binding universal stress UspA family protein